MSKAKLKKHLLSLTKEQVVDIMLELYGASKEANRMKKMIESVECCGFGFPDTHWDMYYEYAEE
jgi:ribosomal protein L20A (L18A)